MKIIFTHKNMNMGGIERALLNLTNEIANDNEVSVLLLNDSFGKEYFNKKINFISTNKTYRIVNQTLMSIIKNCVTKLGLRALLEKLFSRKIFTNENFDIAVAFHGEDYLTCYQVANMIKAKKKYVFIHFDVRKTNSINY